MEKLDYIRELGCTALWLNPCFMSPFMDGGYDISDYFRTAPRYGTNEDLKRLFEEVHRRGMHILLDLVPGHTSVEHPWFKESCRAEKNAFTDRYVWTDSIWEEPEGGSCIRGISERDGSCVVNYFSHQPALNYGYYKPDPAKPWQQPTDGEGPEATVRAMMEVMRFWLKLGCDGFRADMAGSLVKCDREGLGTIGVWQKIRRFLDEEFPEAVMVSEWGEPDKSLLGGFHMDFLLHFVPSHYNDLFRCEHPFFGGQGDAKAFVEKCEESRAKSGGRGLICIPSGNHDMERIAWRLDEEDMKVAFAFLLSMPGAPFIYYGDEIGMYGFADPWNRRTFSWDHIDDGLHDFYVRLGQMRRENTADFTRPLKFFDLDTGVIAYSRGSLLVVVNASESDYQWPAMIDSLVFSTGNASITESGILVSRMSAAVFRLRKEYWQE